MAQPTADIPRTYGLITRYNNLATAGAVNYGSALSDAGGAGTVNQLVDNEDFVGFALQNKATGEDCQIAAEGTIRLTVAGITGVTDRGRAVYATEGDTFSLTDSGTDTQIGVVSRVHDVANTLADVAFQAHSLRSV